MSRIGKSCSFLSLKLMVVAYSFACRFQFFGINGEMNGIGMDGMS